MMRVAGVLTLGVVLVACGSSEAVSVSVADAWARPSAPGQTSGVVYLELTATDDDALVGVSVPGDVAGSAMLHESVADAELTESSSAEHDMGAMTMREMSDGLALPADTAVALAPGGAHVMLVDLVTPLTAGDTFPLTLDFEHAADQTVDVTIAESAP